jgi:hypothetical protein
MNCRKAERFLALSGGGDLTERQAQATALHLNVCERCRALERELAESRRWLERGEAPPFGQAENAALRRSVWREIEARGAASRRSFPGRGRIAFVGAGLLAAAVAVLLVSQREAREPGPPLLPPKPVLASRMSPAPVESSRQDEGSPRSSPVAAVASLRPPRHPANRTARAGDGGVARIEFRTANPNVRIIWLVKKGEETSSALTTGRIQEVS